MDKYRTGKVIYGIAMGVVVALAVLTFVVWMMFLWAACG